MGKQVGLIKVNGNFDGVSFYEKGGQHYARISKGPSKHMLKHSPKYQAFRENQKETGTSMRAVKSLRAGYEPMETYFFDNKFSIRASKILRTMLNRNDGERGTRPLDVMEFKDLLAGLDLNSTLPLQDVFSAPYSFAVNAQRTETTLTIPGFKVTDYVWIPERATHFRIYTLASVLSGFAFDAEKGQHVATDEAANTKHGLALSGYISAEGNSGEVKLAASLPAGTVPAASSALLASVGIHFYEKRGQNYYPITTNAAMKLKQVF